MKKQPEKREYFIVERDVLSDVGDIRGSTRAEAEELLSYLDGSGDYVVIKGELIEPKTKRTLVLE